MTIVEIGYGDGASIQMWHHLFPNAYVICIDRDVEEESERHRVIRGDQCDPTHLRESLLEAPLPISIVIDDGSHNPEHQITTFSHLFADILEPGGRYIIEDIETSYWTSGNLYGYDIRAGLFCRWSAVEAMKLIIDYQNRKFLSEADRSLLEYSMMATGLSPHAAETAGLVAFGQNCAAVTKSIPGDSQYNEGNYLYKEFTKR